MELWCAYKNVWTNFWVRVNYVKPIMTTILQAISWVHILFLAKKKVFYNKHTISPNHLIYIFFLLIVFLNWHKKITNVPVRHRALLLQQKQVLCKSKYRCDYVPPAVVFTFTGAVWHCRASWDDSWVWQMSGTAGCVLDYPSKSGQHCHSPLPKLSLYWLWNPLWQYCNG